MGALVLVGVADRRGGRGHFMLAQGQSDRIHNRRVDERFVALDIDDGVARAPRGHFGNAIRPARMIGRGHFRPAELLRDFPDARVIGRHDHVAQRAGFLALFDHVLEKRLARNQRERLARKTGQAVARRDDAENGHEVRSRSRASVSIHSAAAVISSAITAPPSLSADFRSNSPP